ncbi:hypothetical protein [Archangium sp.]|uniref:hypothetical protein n=1 Tax=Archangium sp. TaxID=1872627 RepID=UPI002EDB8F15
MRTQTHHARAGRSQRDELERLQEELRERRQRREVLPRENAASQRRRGVGTLVVTYKSWPGTPGQQCVQLKDMPEPERLAAWLQAKRSGSASA